VDRAPTSAAVATDVRELSSLRTVLEVFAIERRRAPATTSDLDLLSGVLSPCQRPWTSRRLPHDQLDAQFHDKLYRAAHHDRLWNAWNSIRSQVVLSLVVKRHTSNEYYRHKVIAEHQELFDVVSSRDADACEKAIREHLSATYDRLVGASRTPTRSTPLLPATRKS